jgi:hypothetical protein
MNKNNYPYKWSAIQWQKLCEYESFIQAYILDKFALCDKIATDLKTRKLI